MQETRFVSDEISTRDCYRILEGQPATKEGKNAERMKCSPSSEPPFSYIILSFMRYITSDLRLLVLNTYL